MTESPGFIHVIVDEAAYRCSGYEFDAGSNQLTVFFRESMLAGFEALQQGVHDVELAPEKLTPVLLRFHSCRAVDHGGESISSTGVLFYVELAQVEKAAT